MKLVAQGSTPDLSHPHAMGVLNVMPDSFSDGSVRNSLVKTVKHANLMINAGATTIDIGDKSARSGAAEVNVEEELAWVILVTKAIARYFEVRISVDTSKPGVIRKPVRAGTHAINDIHSLAESGALRAATETGLLVCLIHMQGQPRIIQGTSKYEDVFADVKCFFAEHIVRCERAGIAKERLLLDPGFGFGRNLPHNYQPPVRLGEFRHFRLPLSVSMSRKSMAGQLLNIGPSERLSDSLVCAIVTTMQGAQIIRVHNVKEIVETLRVIETIPVAKGEKHYK